MRSSLFACAVLTLAFGVPGTTDARPLAPDPGVLKAQHNEEISMQARQRLRTYLVGLGARARPPRPAPRPELQPTQPADDAEWIAGEWIWEATAWVWYEGYWDWVGYVATGDDGSSGGGYGGVRDHRRARGGSGRFRDHRNGRDDTPSPASTSTAIRDHRKGDRATFDRDTRDEPSTPPPAKNESSRPSKDREETTSWSSSSGSSSVRDHRDKSDDKRDNDSPTIRDHRKH